MRSAILLWALLASSVSYATDDLHVLPESLQPKQMLSRHLKEQARQAFERRKAAYEKIKTTDDVANYQRRVRDLLLAELGELPERTPLNAKVVGELQGEGYRAEKVLFESQPRHHVPATLFLPTTKPPYPAVLIPAGHSRDGKAAQQRMCILLAKNGIAAMAYDPIGQGERYQLLDGAGKARFKSTEEHTLLGATSMLVGRGTATYRIWDGMRAIDYLCSRPEIDAKRIGVTGCSGGGTLTSYLMALDDRVACAAPSCYLTSFERLLATIGPQDAEQNIHGQIALGIDHADYMTLRAPTPIIVLASTRDFFDISGTWDSYRQAKRIYTRLGHAERLAILETDETHGYPKLQREAMASWMSRWLLRKDVAITEPEFTVHKEAEVLCTPRGQVMLLEGERSVSDLNVELNAKLAQQRRELWRNTTAALEKVRDVAGIRKLAEIPEPAVREAGVIDRTYAIKKTYGYKIHKLVFEPEPGILLPAHLYQPVAKPIGKCLYLDGRGKQAAAPKLEELVEDHIVLAIDLRGSGETGPTSEGLWGGDWNDIFVSYLLGKSIVGMRTEDVLVAARYLSRHDATKSKQVTVIAVGAAGPPALHAAALEPALFDKVELSGSLGSWSEYLSKPEARGQFANSVHGALRVYDLPNLANVLGDKLISRDSPEGH